MIHLRHLLDYFRPPVFPMDHALFMGTNGKAYHSQKEADDAGVEVEVIYDPDSKRVQWLV